MGRPRLFSDEERLERKRARRRKSNMSKEQIDKHNARGRKINLTLEQYEKIKSKNLKINLNLEQLEKKRARNRVSNMTEVQLNDKRKASKNSMSLRRKTNVSFKIYGNISRLVNFMIKSKGSSKAGKSIINYLQWDAITLTQHLESQFEPWMNWNNYGKYNCDTWRDDDIGTWTWQIDHIIPQSDLPYISMQDENFKKCWSLENLRPFSAKQNILDGTSRSRHLKKDNKNGS